MTVTLRPDPGGLISEPGAYRVPMGRYHSQFCTGPSVSSSGLRRIYHESPAHFWVQSDLNPNRIPSTPTAAMDKGRAAHSLVLGDEVFAETFVVTPADAPARPSIASWGAAKSAPHIEDAKAWWRRFETLAAGRTIISASDYDDLAGMAETLAVHPAIRDYGLFRGVAEPTMLWRRGGVWIKSRPDMLPESGLEIGDLKTCASIERGFCERQIRTHGYDMQMALAIEGAKETLGLAISEAVLVFLETAPPYCVRLVPIADETLHYARRQNEIAAETFARCVASGVWPGPADDMRPYAMREWDREEVKAREGLLESAA